jgi:hypothetical protein
MDLALSKDQLQEQLCAVQRVICTIWGTSALTQLLVGLLEFRRIGLDTNFSAFFHARSRADTKKPFFQFGESDSAP